MVAKSVGIAQKRHIVQDDKFKFNTIKLYKVFITVGYLKVWVDHR